MVRRLMTRGSMYSLLLCAATVALWVRSYFVHDAMDFGIESGRAGMVSCRGRIAVGMMRVDPVLAVRVPHGSSYRAEPAEVGASSDLKPGWSSWTGLQAARMRVPGASAWDVRVPYLYPLMVAGMAAGLLMARRWRATRPGLCPVCSYSLAHNTSGVCPECGKAIR